MKNDYIKKIPDQTSRNIRNKKKFNFLQKFLTLDFRPFTFRKIIINVEGTPLFPSRFAVILCKIIETRVIYILLNVFWFAEISRILTYICLRKDIFVVFLCVHKINPLK